MNLALTLAFLFFVGSCIGWGLEVVFRKFFSETNPEHKWLNPGFCTGPYIPLYGWGLCILYLMASLESRVCIGTGWLSRLLMFLAAAVLITAVEYAAGILCLKLLKVRLWDYSHLWGNVQGIICPMFSAIWGVLGAVYYFLVHPYILDALNWLSGNLAFSFFIGLFFGVFIIDVAHSARLVARLRQFAREYDVVVRYEAIKARVKTSQEKAKKKAQFFRPFSGERPLGELLKEMRWEFEEHKSHREGANHE